MFSAGPSPQLGGSVSEAPEALIRLTDEAKRRCGRIPPQLMASLAIEAAQGAGFRVQEAALAALLRRFRASQTDELIVAKRPKRAVLGEYELRRRRDKQSVRPYVTRLESLDPLRATCGCPDFVRGSLGLCKHIACVLDALHANPVRLGAAKALPAKSVALRFLPIRDVLGPADWTSQVELIARSRPSWLESVLRWFARGPTEEVFSFEPGDELPNATRALQRLIESKDYRFADPSPDPALISVLNREAARQAISKRSSSILDKLDKGLASLAEPLYPYQVEGVRRFLERGRMLLADDMGLGKTAQAIAAAHLMARGRLVRRGLVVAPASLRTQWAREWGRFSDFPIAVVDGSPSQRLDQYAALDRGFLVLGYETLLRDLGALMGMGVDMVILDEAQRIKNWETQSARAVKKLDVPFRLVLTGTPLENRIDELASIMDWVDDTALEPKWRLAPFHLRPNADADEGSSMIHELDTLRARLSPAMLRRNRAGVLAQLPERTDTRVPIVMTLTQVNEHEALRIPIAALIQAAQRRPLTRPEFLKLMRLFTEQRIISNGMAQRDFDEVWSDLEPRQPSPQLLERLDSPKLLELRGLVDNLVQVQDRKVVIFSQWRKMIRLAHWAVRDILERSNSRAAFFTGAESMKMRDYGVVAFHDDPSTRVMFLTDAGGVGLNLQRAASACINLELPWNPAVLEQRIGRIYRNGQKRPIDVFNLIAEGGIEGRIEKVIGNKRALFTSLFDSESNEVKFESGSSFAESMSLLAGETAELEVSLDVALETEDEVVLEDEAAAFELFSEAQGTDQSVPTEPKSAPSVTATFEAPSAGPFLPAASAAAPPVETMSAMPVAATFDIPSPASAAEVSVAGGGREPAKPPVTFPTPPHTVAVAPGLSPMSALSLLRVERTTEGGLRIEAPKEAAETLAGMFEAFGALLRAGVTMDSRNRTE
ncbi:MAG: DEAD/DEAH box helicase [Deltaproteobacteria bacterium]|nr:DEAD/DEAH box helicase [Deltaproteobacteria bacterium]